jgi:hypothetical protein
MTTFICDRVDLFGDFHLVSEDVLLKYTDNVTRVSYDLCEDKVVIDDGVGGGFYNFRTREMEFGRYGSNDVIRGKFISTEVNRILRMYGVMHITVRG